MSGLYHTYCLLISNTNQDDLPSFGIYAFLEGEYDEAEEVLKESLEKNPEDISSLRYLAPTLLQLEKYDKAKEHYLQIKNLPFVNPKNGKADVLREVLLSDILRFERINLFSKESRTAVAEIKQLLIE